jgi:hypothetical protein
MGNTREKSQKDKKKNATKYENEEIVKERKISLEQKKWGRDELERQRIAGKIDGENKETRRRECAAYMSSAYCSTNPVIFPLTDMKRLSY